MMQLTFSDEAQYSELQAIPDVDHRVHERSEEPVEHPRVAVDARAADVGLRGEDVLLDDFRHVLLKQERAEELQV